MRRNNCFLIILIECAATNVFRLARSETIPSWQSVVADTNTVIGFTNWTLSNADNNKTDTSNSSTNSTYYHISAQVPGDLLSDLMRAEIIDDPYFNRNFLTQRHVWMGGGTSSAQHFNESKRTRTWIYSTQFTLPSSYNATLLLVAESIKMGACVELNGVKIGTARNQFLRYVWELIPQALLQGELLSGSALRRHKLKVVFDPNILTDGRFMACSGGWDWAPYSRSYDSRGSRIMSLGIPQAIYAVAARKALLTHIVPKIYYQGEFPDAPMWSGPQGDFVVSVHVFVKILDPTALHRYSIVLTSDLLNEPIVTPLSLFDGEKLIINMTATKHQVDLWWPNGLGNQHLYKLEIALNDGSCYHEGHCQSMGQRIGFRTIALVTANDTDPSVLDTMIQQSTEGSGIHGMYFRVNGAIIWARGANVVPMDQLEGRFSDEGHVELVRSAASANMNMLRVWGGGLVLPKSFYNACDEHGILLFHDLMFVEEGHHGALRTSTVHKEIGHTVRSLASHPSIVVWNGCNECSGRLQDMDVYESFVMTTVAEIDDTRPIWVSSPSPHGWASGVNMLDGRPNGKSLRVRHWNRSETCHAIESHGPYQRGYSEIYSGVNGRQSSNSNESLVPPILLYNESSGAGHLSTFVSEFGATSYPSFESLSATLHNSAWSVHGGTVADTCEQVIENENVCNGTNAMAERNYPCDNRIKLYFGSQTSLDAAGPVKFQRQLYECMIAQTLWMKGRLEMVRASNSFGSLIWQLNENWPTGGWGCVEYGPRNGVGGQIVGGRWKPLMFLLRRYAFRDSIVACGQDGLCFARCDCLNSTLIKVKFEAWRIGAEHPIRTFNYSHSHAAGRSTQFFSLPTGFVKSDADVTLVEQFSTEHEPMVNVEAFLLKVPRDMNRLIIPVSISVSLHTSVQSGFVRIDLISDTLALYIVLSTAAQGRFSDNAFHLRPNVAMTVYFEKLFSDGSVDFALFYKTLHLEHLGRNHDIKFHVTDNTAIL
ncbi:hypothetical protein MPSEU_000797800 [Mayamaea pseudoterrestris]|nr:hypothetical protein MPSEU_000797800 [Mayamaea pseudoterrestris]